MKSIKIVFSAIFSDAGDFTRALEIATAIRMYKKDGYEPDIIFLSNGSRFDGNIIESGFKIHKCNPRLSGIGYNQDFKPAKGNLVGDVKLAEELIKGEIEAFEALKPDVVIYGFYPIAGIARRLMKKEILGICYIPLPIRRDIVDSSIMRDLPDVMKPFVYLPKPVRRWIWKVIPKDVKTKMPPFKQENIVMALKNLQLYDDRFEDLFEMLKADLTVVNDFKEFHMADEMPCDYKITGPLYCPPQYGEMDENILKVFNKDNKRLKIFCTLGSSGSKQQLLEVLKALSIGIGKEWCAVVLAPASVCQMDDIIQYASENIYITDKFVPTTTVNALADIVISHGGQGTLQTAIASGTPIIGYGLQTEQQINLNNIEYAGGGIRIPMHRWNYKNIQKAVKKVEKNPSYKENIERLKKILEETNSRKNSAEEIWHVISSACYDTTYETHAADGKVNLVINEDVASDMEEVV